MALIAFDAFAVQVPRGWADITSTVDSANPPRSLAHHDGVGSLQFTIVLDQGSIVPCLTPADLQEMVVEFGRMRKLGAPLAIDTDAGPPMLAAGSFTWDDDFVRVWFVSVGGNFAFVSYTCAAAEKWRELVVCEQIVRSIVFQPEMQAAGEGPAWRPERREPPG